MTAGRFRSSGEHRWILKFLRAAATHTHQMVMVAVGVASQLEAAPSLRQLQLLQQAHATEQTQGAVHRGQGHTLLGAQQPLVHLFSTQVAAFADPLKQLQHPLTLGR